MRLLVSIDFCWKWLKGEWLTEVSLMDRGLMPVSMALDG